MINLEHFNPFNHVNHQHITNILAIRFWGVTLTRCRQLFIKQTTHNGTRWRQTYQCCAKEGWKEKTYMIIIMLATQPCLVDKWGKK